LLAAAFTHRRLDYSNGLLTGTAAIQMKGSNQYSTDFRGSSIVAQCRGPNAGNSTRLSLASCTAESHVRDRSLSLCGSVSSVGDGVAPAYLSIQERKVQTSEVNTAAVSIEWKLAKSHNLYSRKLRQSINIPVKTGNSRIGFFQGVVRGRFLRSSLPVES